MLPGRFSSSLSLSSPTRWLASPTPHPVAASDAAAIAPLSREEAEVVAILLGELDQARAQRLGRLLDKLLKVDDL